ncbi:MAG: sigma-70 family RNA polymerase sigma factor [Syntrophomonadaceae bacterium]
MVRIKDRLEVSRLNPLPVVADDPVASAIEKYADMVRRICFLYLRNSADIEDVFQEVFLRYFLNLGKYENGQHEKAWLCRVTFNKCKDLNRSFWRQKVVVRDSLEISYENPEQGDLIRAVLQLPSKYKEVIYLHYYEGWTIPEIAEIMEQNVNTVYTRLRRAKDKLRAKVGEIEL